MKITIKTTQQKVFQIDIDGSDTVATLKQKIHELQKYDIASQKIIYSGKILPDDKTIESCGIKEKDFLVLMVSKPKTTPAPAESSSSTPPAPAPVAAPVPVEASTTPAPSAPATPAAPPPAPTTPAPATQATPAPAAAAAPSLSGDNSFVTGEALQTTINNMIEMGFPREQVLRALRASFNNPDRAAEYLMTGIPANLDTEATPSTAPPAQPSAVAPAPAAAVTPATPQAQPQVPTSQPQNLFQLAQQQQQQGQQQIGGRGPAGPAPGFSAGAPGALDANMLNALRNSPLIQQLREQIATNPANAQLFVQQLAQQNPVLAQQLASNPEILMNLLGLPEEGDEEAVPPGAHVLSVTPEERAAIERLEALGFSRQAVLEAYFACDRNEELAANFLFEGGFED